MCDCKVKFERPFFSRSKLTADDCNVIGHLAVLNKDYYYASLWLETALVRLQAETSSNGMELELSILRKLVKSYDHQSNHTTDKSN